MTDGYTVFQPPPPWEASGLAMLPTVVDGNDFPKSVQSASLLQISRDITSDDDNTLFIDKITIDIGWMPEADPSGRFIGVVIKNYDWQNPLYRIETRDTKKLHLWLLGSIRAFEERLQP